MSRKHLRTVRDALAATGLPYALRGGSRHVKLFLGGQLVGVVPYDDEERSGNALARTLAQIRRAARGLNAQQ